MPRYLLNLLFIMKSYAILNLNYYFFFNVIKYHVEKAIKDQKVWFKWGKFPPTFPLETHDSISSLYCFSFLFV